MIILRGFFLYGVPGKRCDNLKLIPVRFLISSTITMQGETFSFREFCLHWRSEDAYENDRSCWWCDGLCPSIKTLTWSDPGVYLFAVKSATRIRYIVTRSWMISRWAWLKKLHAADRSTVRRGAWVSPRETVAVVLLS